MKVNLEDLLKNTGDMALKRRAKRIINELDLEDGDVVLDVGCGDGFYLHLLSELGFKVKLSGVDYDPNALKSAKRNLKGRKIKLTQGDLMKRLPFRAKTFDRVIISEVVEHLPDDIKGLSEVYRVLKPGGIMCLSVPNKNYPFLWDPVNWFLEEYLGTHIKRGFWAGIWNQHIRLYKPEGISKSVGKVGFKIEKIQSLTWWCLPFNHNLVYMVARRLYGGGLPFEVAKAVSKFELGSSKKSFVFGLAFRIVNFVDKLNDIYQPKDSGVGVFVKARK